MLVKSKNGTIKEIIYNETQLLQYGINRLGEREYLRQELFIKMQRLQPDSEIINQVLDKLVSFKYLDEERAINMYLNKYQGKEAIAKTKQRLRQKGANTEALEQCLATKTEQQNSLQDENSELTPSQQEAFNLLSKRFTQYDQSKYDKMMRYLLSKGYRYADVKSVINHLKHTSEFI